MWMFRVAWDAVLVKLLVMLEKSEENLVIFVDEWFLFFGFYECWFVFVNSGVVVVFCDM